MAKTLFNLNLAEIETFALLQELQERLDRTCTTNQQHFYARSDVRQWIIDNYVHLVYYENESFPSELSMFDREKFDFFIKHYQDIPLELLEKLAK